MLDAYKVGRLRDQAKGRVGEARLLNARELNGLAMPELALDDEALIRVEMTKILLSRFPYVRNYELMLLAEIAALQRPLTPLFLRERALSGKGGQIDRALIERWGKAVAGISSVTGEPDAHRWQGALTDRTIAICGSGPLPMSALFLHLFTGAAVVLIDMERTAVVRSQRLITNLERLGILKPGVLAVRRVNAADVSFHHPNRLSGNMADTSVTCDAVMVASLVDHNAKTSIATQLCVDHGAPKLLIMRSATGLSAQLAYDPVPAEGFNRGNLVYCGETMPATQIAVHLDRIEAIRRGVACKESPDLLAIAHPDVVNTTEIYRKIATYPESFQLDFSACETVEDWIRELEIAGARLGAAEPKNRMG
jgi:hypothetical protein